MLVLLSFIKWCSCGGAHVVLISGAGHIAKRLQDSGIDKLDFVLDEGYFVLEDMVEGVDQLVSV